MNTIVADTKGWTRRRAFWVAYVVLAAIALFTALRLFPQAIPLLNLDIKLARHDAVANAIRIAQEQDLAPPGARTAVRFTHDDDTQNYVELEGGGKRAFTGLLEGGAYAPYWWEVRLFAPGEITESIVRFRPDGTPYGFTLKLPETYAPPDPAGLALTEEAARAIAEREAAAHWNVDFAHYKPLEHTLLQRTNGRVDHAFVYERKDASAGEARFRVRLGVAGNRLNDVTHFAFVPDAFERRYQELRSANNTIAGAATLTAGVLYGLGGCVIGLLWLLREHWLLWRPALRAGFVVGGLMAAASLASTPTAWFGYDTAEPLTSFWGRQIGAGFTVLILGGLAYALVFMAAESLSRRAFPRHPQLWKLWTGAAAATPQTIGRTVGGYLFVALELAFIALFYYATNRWLGWWQPSESLTDPNILGSAVPALSPIALSLQAGFMEESVFRAVPLSLAALIGARYGHRNAAIAIAVLLQALVFGGAHANYPGFPSYSRLVELIVPSIIWALLFLRFGLLVTVLLHALFDLSLFSIPLFLVDAPGATLQRVLVVAAGLTPLAIVLLQRLRAGRWHEMPEALRNAGWQLVRPADEVELVAPSEVRELPRWIRGLHRALPVLGVAGLVIWASATQFRPDVPTLPVSRKQAIDVAEEALRARGVELDSEWKRFARVRLAPNDPSQSMWHEFVWREGGPAKYEELIGNTLAPPQWEVRFARFTGDVAQRAEEWRVTVVGTGKVRQVRHDLPEARPGASLDRDQALAVAQRAIREQIGLDPARLRLISAVESQKPARRDWTFGFTNPDVQMPEGGEARVQAGVAGDEAVYAGRYVFIPETWTRQESERESQFTFVKLAIAAFSALILVSGLVFAAMQWMRGRFDKRALWRVIWISFAVAVVSIANNWPQMAMNLRTSEPVITQASLSIVAAVFGSVFAALTLGLLSAIGAWATVQRPPFAFAGRWPAWLAGVCAALIVAGFEAGLSALAPQTSPAWPTYALAGQAVPFLGAAILGAGALGAIGVGLFILAWLERVTRHWQRHLWLAAGVLLLVLTAIALVGTARFIAALLSGAITGAGAVVIVYGVLRFDLRTVPAYIATGLIAGIVESAAHNATPMSYAEGAVAVIAIVAITIAVMRYLDRQPAAAAPSSAVPVGPD